MDSDKEPFSRPYMLVISVAVTAILILLSVRSGNFLAFGEDLDDVFRFIQIRDWLNGQSWFHTDQYRLGVNGTDMHWSRLPDLPIYALTLIFDVFMPKEAALMWATAIWPPILGGLFIMMIMTVAAQLGGRSLQIFMAVIAFVFMDFSGRFHPGAIDHHNLQFLFMFGAVGALIVPLKTVLTGLISGLCLAACVAIGVEINLFCAVICMAVAFNWAIKGVAVKRLTQGFGVGFALGLLTLFIMTVAPSEYARDYCDQLSRITVVAGLIGGGGLALSAYYLTEKPLIGRFAVLVILGVVSLSVLVMMSPQCLTNPLKDLPPEVKTHWLSNVIEAKPIMAVSETPLRFTLHYIGMAFIAAGVLVWGAIKTRLTFETSLMIALLTVASVMTFYQLRFSNFAFLFAILPMAVWADELYAKKRENPKNLSYIVALFLATPFGLGLPYLINKPPTQTQVTGVDCYAPDVLDALNTLPNGLVSTPANGGIHIIKDTDHSAVSGNYHRNIEGLSLQIQTALNPAEEAVAGLKEAGVDYVLFCETGYETDIFVKAAPQGFFGQLQKGTVPVGLTPLKEGLGADGVVTIYGITP